MLGLSVAAPESGQMYQAMAHELVRQRGHERLRLRTFVRRWRRTRTCRGFTMSWRSAASMLRPDLKLRAEAEKEYVS